ncbi:MAG: TonB-dependent receptor, partial [Deltaproteobacteria bacterium]|nr:TonB-dependent receptor [Deltaproteobacteria bacterium]
RRVFDYSGASSIGKTSKTGHPAWSGRAGLRYEREIAKALSVHADAYSRFARRAWEKTSATQTDSYAGWSTANLALGAEYGEKQKFFADLNLNNLLNKNYTLASSSLEEPGLHLVLRLGAEF